MKFQNILPFWAQKTSYHFLILIIVLSFFSTISLTVALRSFTEYLDWQDTLKSQAIIIASTQQKGQDIYDIIRQDPVLDTIEILKKDDIITLMTPWLGSMDGLSIPIIISLKFKPDSNLDALIKRSKKIDNAAVFHHGGAVETGAIGAQIALMFLGIIGLFITLIALITMARMASNHLVIIHRRSIEIVHILGLPDQELLNIFVQFGRKLSINATAIGCSGAGITMIIIETLYQYNQLFPSAFDHLQWQWLAPFIMIICVPILVVTEIKHQVRKILA